ncbi:MAG: aldolase/citrate lyase family protein [Dehalococcoidales bacterium]|nr:aldolase/citrate lyase family protein [Dehalococcoidales bacterium]
MKNLLKEKLQKNQFVIGTFVGLGHPDVTERLSRIGFDWLLIDGEHAPLGLETMQQMMQSMNRSNCTPLVRPQWNDIVTIKRVLDIGDHGVLIQRVNTKEEAEYTVSACKYPPEGLRGCGPRRAALFDQDYLKTANDEILVIVQIETRKAVDNINDILAVKEIDACYIGPMDLSRSFGFESPKWDNPPYLAAFDKVLATAQKCGNPAGIFASQENIR